MSDEKKFMDKLFKGYMLPDRFPLIAVNTFFAGYFFSENGLAAFSFVLPIYFLFIVIGFAINFGAFSLAVKSIGHSETESARRYSSSALFLSILTGIILAAVVNIFFEPLIELFGVPQELYPLVGTYGRLMGIAGFFLVISLYILQFLKLFGMQTQLKKVYKIMLVMNAAIGYSLMKFFNFGMEALAISMIIALAFCIIFEGVQLYKRVGKNLFAQVTLSEIPITEMLKASSAITLSKIFSLSQILMFNYFLFKIFGIEGVSVFSSLQIAIRICRTGSGMTLQGITPILTIEHSDKNLTAILLMLKIAIKRAMIFAVLFTIALVFFGDKFTQNPMTVEALKIYAFSLIPAYINAIMITIFLTLGHLRFSNLLAFLRSFLLLILFLIFAQDYVWWSFLFAEITTLIILIIGNVILSKKENLRTPLLLKLEEFKPTLYFVVNREKGLSEEHSQKNFHIPSKTKYFGVAKLLR
jgi:Na+-driven multidrug efflux pump